MLDFYFVEKGPFAKLTPQKRILRFLIGGLLIAYFVWQLTVYETLLTTDFLLIPWGKWIGVAILFYFFSDVFNIGFNRRWGRWPQYSFLILVAAAIGFNLLRTGTFWGPAAGWPVYLMQQITAGMLGVGFIISSVLAIPG